MTKKTVILGATTNKERYAYTAAERLAQHKHPIVPIGIKKGEVLGQPILNLKERPQVEDIDTVTMYINPTNQKAWEDYILSLKPNRIIFNPGTENPQLEASANQIGIETINACTLVMLSVGNY